MQTVITKLKFRNDKFHVCNTVKEWRRKEFAIQ